MSSPKAIIQIFVTGSKILGKAFLEAGRQAVKNAKYTPQGVVGDASGVGNATSGSPTDQLTRQHRMTLDEAQLILNVKRDDQLETILKNYEHLFKANSPPAKAEKQKPAPRGATSKQAAAAYHSHYLQSKVVRARERIEAELKLAESSSEEAASESSPKAEKGTTSSTEPPPPSSGSTQ
ncbi:hypothetical protein CVT24_006512 [Panaeolus cyanescens]|uniref:Mitochondrial import inner membrane translocase subunit TIM16 n=1 Tax=Panaeolus cyanescens TaxID=181874 RepID=A0A409WNG9_9AGAR|nr:hypothetical protein CVT24_006512 [Panaeolus cyanescens]